MPGRGNTTQRGYGSPHQRLRERWEPLVKAGRVDCAALLCLVERDGGTRRIRPGEPWDLGHDDDRRRYRGPEHQACNRGASRRVVSYPTPALDPEPRPTSNW